MNNKEYKETYFNVFIFVFLQLVRFPNLASFCFLGYVNAKGDIAFVLEFLGSLFYNINSQPPAQLTGETDESSRVGP